MRACVQTCVCVGGCVCVWGGGTCVRARASVRACMRALVRASKRACVRACVCVCVFKNKIKKISLSPLKIIITALGLLCAPAE